MWGPIKHGRFDTKIPSCYELFHHSGEVSVTARVRDVQIITTEHQSGRNSSVTAPAVCQPPPHQRPFVTINKRRVATFSSDMTRGWSEILSVRASRCKNFSPHTPERTNRAGARGGHMPANPRQRHYSQHLRQRRLFAAPENLKAEGLKRRFIRSTWQKAKEDRTFLPVLLMLMSGRNRSSQLYTTDDVIY